MKKEVYKDKNGEWRWRLISAGDIIADSSEGYKNKAHAIKMAAEIQPEVETTVIDED